MKNSITTRISCFISPHGFGHAARAAAVMEAIGQQLPAAHFDIFTRVPRWFFCKSLTAPFSYHSLLTDIGLVQSNSLHEDLGATIERLVEFLPFDQTLISQLARQLRRSSPPSQLVLCDIAPLGIAVAREAGIPSLLIENFTWDWIYDGYPDFSDRLAPFISYLKHQFEHANFHVQTEPVCRPQPAHLKVGPVSRAPRALPSQIRRQLGIASDSKMVLLTMGGMAWDYTFLTRLKQHRGVYFVISGNNLEGQGNLIALGADSDIFHPDLINAADVVIGKVGYSTLAEVYQAAVPFGYMARPRFRESVILTAYIEENMSGLPITEQEFLEGSWLTTRLPELLVLPRRNRPTRRGTTEIAAFVSSLLVEPRP